MNSELKAQLRKAEAKRETATCEELRAMTEEMLLSINVRKWDHWPTPEEQSEMNQPHETLGLLSCEFWKRCPELAITNTRRK